MQTYYLGIDGGGTKTQLNVINDKNELVYEAFCGGSSIDSGIEFSEIKKMLTKEFSKIPFVVSSTFAGLGGINSPADKKLVKDFLVKKVMSNPYSTYDVGSDVENALDGALDFKDGIILIAGTGSVSFGRYKGNYFRSGGYCYQEGEVGSAYYLGHKAMEYYARVLDGRKEPSEFSSAIEEATRMHNFAGIVHFFTTATRREFADLAKVVTKFQDFDEARKIIEDGVDGVFEMVKAVYSKLGFTGKVRFSIIGSLGNADTLYKKLLLEKIEKELPNIVYQQPVYSAAMGAALKAKENYQLHLKEN